MQKLQVLQLWNSEYPKQIVYPGLHEFDEYLNGLKQLYHWMAIDDKHDLVGWAFLFERDTENWFAIIVARNQQKQGLGKRLLALLKKEQQILNGWAADNDRYEKTDGTKYLSPLTFYLNNGFTICPNDRLETDKLSAVKITWQNARDGN